MSSTILKTDPIGIWLSVAELQWEVPPKEWSFLGQNMLEIEVEMVIIFYFFLF